mmetsp:Transcript_46221/g.46697  ORF Transcript_46221/g.46697 Transcript_46221/m.46697 type:complete len:92 (-) Transcript_46221:39-314(-)
MNLVCGKASMKKLENYFGNDICSIYIYFIMYYVQDVCCKLLFGCRLNYSKYYQEKMQNICRARIILWAFILAIFSLSVYVYKTIKNILLFV